MSVCFLPYDMKINSIDEKIKYRYMPKISIPCNMSKNKLSEIIQYSFIGFNDFSVFGFNTINEEFWAKKFNKNKYLLHFTMCIQSYGYENCSIVISPLVGNDTEIMLLYNKIKEIVNLYEPSLK